MNTERQIEYLKNFITEKRFERFVNVLNQRTRYVTVVLEDVFQGHNAAAVLRSCDCFGVQDIYCAENRNEFKPNEEVSMGAGQWLNIYRFREKEKNNTEICYQTLREKGYKIVATSPHANAVSIKDLKLDAPIALVFGAEKEGLTEYALNNADESVFIPMYGFTESFNISVTVALCLYELINRLRNSNINYSLSEQEKQEILLQWMKNSIKDADRILERLEEK
ncbi:MAG TPA: RNA methyltransferase [Bacteroidia bacterium]|nr:RNA methyltransferase [Bacteroidia bacterium]